MKKGFTLVELMIVIGVIAILSLVLYPALTSYIYRSKVAVVNFDFARITKVIETAYIMEQKTLIELTGDFCSECNCRPPGFFWGSYLGKVNVAIAGNACYDRQLVAWKRIQEYTPADLKIPPRDPWGGLYLLNENYREDPNNPCIQDQIRSAGPDSIIANADVHQNYSGKPYDDIIKGMDFPAPCP